MVGITMGLAQVMSDSCFGGGSLITDFGTEGLVLMILVTRLSDGDLLGVSLLSFVCTSFISVDCFLTMIGVELADIFSSASVKFWMWWTLSRISRKTIEL